MEEKYFWEIVEIQGFVYKDDEEIAEGYGLTIFTNTYDEDINDYEIEYDDPDDIIVNGEVFDIDYDEHEISWENQEVIDGPFDNLDEANKALESYLQLDK